MVNYIDLRNQNGGDTLRRLVQQLRTPASTPHGVKVARPGESTTYYDRSGIAHIWDGDVIADLDKRVGEAVKVVEKAKETLAAAETSLSDARDRIQQVEARTTDEKIAGTAVKAIQNAPQPLFNGRSLILPGTLDVKQLNVTEQLAAEIVRAMSTETKKLVVTEEAIIQRATVVESIVTPELIAKRINVEDLSAKILTGGWIQTDKAADRGMKISSTGLAAFDATGRQTVKIDAAGEENFFVGTFSTAARDKAGMTAYSTVARGVTGSRASVLEMRPLDADMRAPIGRIRMDPQGAFYMGVASNAEAPEYDIKGLYIDVNGGVNISDSLRVLTNMRLEGRFSQTQSYFHMSVGPQNLPPRGGWTEIKINFTDQGQIPFITAQAITNYAVTANIRNRTSSSCSLFLHNLDSSAASDIWVELLFHPLNRNT